MVLKLFLRYADDIVRTVRSDPRVLLEAANKLHSNLQLKLEELDTNNNLAFLVLNISLWVVPKTHRYRYHFFMGCALLLYKRNVFERMVHRIFSST